MRHVAVALTAIALLIPAAFAANIVDFNRPRVIFVDSASAQNACNQVSHRGCTLLNTEFFCNCARSGSDWTPAPRLIATPHVYTTTHEIVRHEIEHIADVRSSLTAYAVSLTLHTFHSEEACSSYISEEKKLFATTLRNIQYATTVRRDGERYADRSEGH